MSFLLGAHLVTETEKKLRQATEKGRGAQLVGQRWDKAFGDNAAMVKDLHLAESLVPLSRFELNEYQAAEMKCVLDAFIRVHTAAGATLAYGGVALVDLSQGVIMEVLNETKFGEKGGLPMNMTWVITQLRSGMDVVATFVENLSRERLTAVRHFLYKLGVAGENPPSALFEQCDVTLRGPWLW